MSKGEAESKRKHKERLDELQRKTNKKIDYHMQKAYVDAADFYHLIKDFFLELLDKKYEPTYEELIHDLDQLKHEYLMFTKGQRKEARDLLTKLSEAEYRGKEFNQDEAKKILSSFKELANKMTSITSGSIETELHRGFVLLESKDKDGAFDAYNRARKMYDSLSKEEKLQYYQDLQELFNAIN